MAKRLFDNYPGPVAIFLFRQPHGAQSIHDGRKKSRRDRKIKEPVAAGIVSLVRLFNLFLQALVRFRVLEIAFHKVEAL